MAENLKVTHYNDGTPIPTGYSYSEWSDAETGAYAVYGNADTYGYLYNWYAVGTGNLAPDGWHVPTDEEWMELEMALGMSESEAQGIGWRGTNQGSQLAGNPGLWNNSGSLDNNEGFGTSGFDGLPGGYRPGYDGNYISMGYYAYFWSSTDDDNINVSAWYRDLHFNYSEVYRNGIYKRYGFSVRCLAD